MSPKRPDLGLLEETVAPSILHAMRAASKRLTELGVRHALVGGLAVGAHGYPRSTRDVDFLVGEEAFEHHPGGFVTMKPGLPIQVEGVAVDFLSVGADEPFLQAALTDTSTDEIRVAPATALIYLKLKSPRQKDLADVVELIKAGLDAAGVRSEIAVKAPNLVPRLDTAIAAAQAESEE